MTFFRAVPHRHRAFDGCLRRVDLQGPFHAEDRQKVYALHRPLFGGFQALMPLTGYLLGSQFSGYIERFDHWIAFVLLALIGL